jgi:hypothetical protein
MCFLSSMCFLSLLFSSRRRQHEHTGAKDSHQHKQASPPPLDRRPIRTYTISDQPCRLVAAHNGTYGWANRALVRLNPYQMTPKNSPAEGRYNFRDGKCASHIASAGRLHIVRAACLPHHTPWTNVSQRRFVLRSYHSRTDRSVATRAHSESR